jgi:hypothetical protein
MLNVYEKIYLMRRDHTWGGAGLWAGGEGGSRGGAGRSRFLRSGSSWALLKPLLRGGSGVAISGGETGRFLQRLFKACGLIGGDFLGSKISGGSANLTIKTKGFSPPLILAINFPEKTRVIFRIIFVKNRGCGAVVFHRSEAHFLRAFRAPLFWLPGGVPPGGGRKTKVDQEFRKVDRRGEILTDLSNY